MRRVQIQRTARRRERERDAGRAYLASDPAFVATDIEHAGIEEEFAG